MCFAVHVCFLKRNVIMSKKVQDTAIYVAHEDFLPFDTSESEKTLLRAVLEGAIEDLEKHGLELSLIHI